MANETEKILDAIAELKSEMATAKSLAALSRKVSQIASDVAYMKDNLLGDHDIAEMRKSRGGAVSSLPQAAKSR